MAGLLKYFSDQDGGGRRIIRVVRRCMKNNGARIYRRLRRFDQIVGVTGSGAKSTTTALVAEILQQSGRVHLGHGYNTIGGMTGGFWRAPVGAKYWVQEISGHKPGKMAPAAAFVRPTIAIITTIQLDHIKQFDDEDHIAAEKGNLLDALPHDGIAVLNADDPRVLAMRERCNGRNIITFGKSKDADIRALSWSEGLPGRLSVEITDGKETVCFNTRFVGSRWILAILAAVAGARAVGLSLSDCRGAIENHSQEFLKDSPHVLPDGTMIVLDSWKSGLWTVPTSIETVGKAEFVRKTMIVGTLSDYRGSSSPKYRRTARAALDVADRVIFYGPNSGRVNRLKDDYPGRLHTFHKIADLQAHLMSDAVPGELIYVKAAGMADHLERLLLDRLEPVSCWLDRCGWQKPCAKCKHLYRTRLRTKRVMRDLNL